MSTSNTTDPRPIPGALDGERWSVRCAPPADFGPGRRSLGSTDVRQRTMLVPEAGSTAARWVALHELGHARWTPKTASPRRIAATHRPATELDIQIVEDLRINSLLSAAGLLRIPRDSQHDIETLGAHYARGFADARMRPQVLEALTLGWVQSATVSLPRRTAGLDGSPAGFEHRLMLHHAAKAISTAAGPDSPAAEEALRQWSRLVETAEEIGSETATILAGNRGRSIPFARVGPAAAHLRRRLLAEVEIMRAHEPPPGDVPVRGDTVGVEWGTLHDMPPLALTETSPSEGLLRRTISTPAGPRLRSLRRLLTDGRAFARTVRRPGRGGTVLIDTSGSMRLQPADLHRVLAEIPAATVAIYSGRKDRGVVSIVARNGRIAPAREIRKRMYDAGRGNVVDGPALDWLGRQPGPRLWVCDGVVTGCRDTCSRVLSREAEAIRRRHDITRHQDIAALVTALREETP